MLYRRRRRNYRNLLGHSFARRHHDSSPPATVLKVLIYRYLDVLSFYIPSQHNIAYHYKHNIEI
jgi:hypothetical protein